MIELNAIEALLVRNPRSMLCQVRRSIGGTTAGTARGSAAAGAPAGKVNSTRVRAGVRIPVQP